MIPPALATHAEAHSATEEAVETAVETVSWLGRMADYINNAFVSILFSIVFVVLIVWIIRINWSGSAEYRKFYLAHMIMREDGKLDRKALERALLFLASMYGFFYVVHKHPELIVPYFIALAGVWLGYQVLDNKIRSAPKPGDTPPATEEAKP